MKTIMLTGFALVILGCFTGNVPMLLIGVIAQLIGTFGSLEEMHRD